MGKLKTLGIIAVIAVIGLMAINCDNGTMPGGDDSLPIVQSRYQTVLYNSADFGRSAAGGDPYVLVSSAKEHDESAYYYLYYMGYVKSVPIAYKTTYEYNGITPITIMYEKSWITEDAIVESMTTARDETWSVDTSVTAGVEMSSEVGAAPFATVSMKVSLSTTVGSGYAETISTSNTYETSKTKIEGETESISATIGEHGESKGLYRYALFGTTDVYCLFTVDPSSREIQAIGFKNLAREMSYAWGIDYHGVGGSFGKTGTGDLFEVPDIDFSKIAAPTEALEAPPEPPPPELKTVWSEFREDQHKVVDYEKYKDKKYYPDLDISRLKAAGYKSITFKLEFQAWEIYDGYVNVWVYVNDKEQGKSYDKIDLASSKWDTKSVTFNIPISAFNSSSSNTLVVHYDGSGDDEDDYRLGNRTVTLTAEK